MKIMSIYNVNEMKNSRFSYAPFGNTRMIVISACFIRGSSAGSEESDAFAEYMSLCKRRNKKR